MARTPIEGVIGCATPLGRLCSVETRGNAETLPRWGWIPGCALQCGRQAAQNLDLSLGQEVGDTRLELPDVCVQCVPLRIRVAAGGRGFGGAELGTERLAQHLLVRV